MQRMPYRGGMPGGEVAANTPLQRARLALANNQPMEAERICRARLERRAGSERRGEEIQYRLLLAQALLQMQRHREAITEAERVLKEQPDHIEGLMLLSSALVGNNPRNPPKEATEAAERAVARQPRSARTHVQLAEVLMVRQEFERALEEADEAIRLEPRQPAGYLIKSMVLINRKQYAEARDAASTAIRQDKTLAAAWLTRAQARAELKEADEAMADLKEAQRLNPMLPPDQIIQLKSTIYRRQRRYRDAYNVFLDQINTRTNGKNRFAPILAGISFLLSFFGQNAPFVLVGAVVVILFALLFGISKIPVAGGALVALISITIAGFLGWNAIKLTTGNSPLALIRQGTTLGLAVGALVLGAVLTFLVYWLIMRFTTPSGHHIYWFTATSAGLAGVIAIIAASVATNYAPALVGRRG